jgi:Transglycosylase SLT domain
MATRDIPTSYKDPFWSDLAASTEQKLGLPSGLLVSVLTRGERSNADQVSEAGARTPFQIIPATRKAVLDKYGIDAYLSPENAAEAAGRLLKESLDRNQGNIVLAAAEYHGGTDPKNWGPRTKSYMQRVSQGVRELNTPPPTIAEGGTTSTFQRALGASSMASVPQDAIARVYQAYSTGQMTAEEAAEFENDVKAGTIMLPRGAALRGQAQPQGARPSIPELPASVLQAYSTGRMTRDEMMELERDVANGMARVPAGFQLQKTEPMGVLGGIREAVTGTERATPTTQALPDWASMPELNTFSMASFKSALGTLMTNPQETVQVIQANFPGVKVAQDEKGNFVLQSSIDGQFYAIKPGFQVSDIPRAAGALAAFTPAGRATTIPGAIVAGGATQAGIEATQAATGGRFDTGEVALAGALGGAGQAITRIPQAVRAVRGGEVPPTPAAAPGAAPVAPGGAAAAPVTPAAATPGAPMGTAMAPAAPVAAAAPAAGPAMMTAEELAATTRQAAGGGFGAGRATTILAGQAAPDPKVLEAARRLKIEQYLQPDHLTSNQAYRELAQAVKSVPGSQARAAEIAGLEQVGKQADDLITRIGGMTDLSRMNQAVRTNLDQTVTNLERQANKVYDDLRANVPAQTRGPADNVLTFVEQRALDLDGPQNLSSLEKSVRRKLTPREIKDEAGNVVGMRYPTYALIDDVRRDIGAAARQQGPFADADTGLAKRLYALIDDDQFSLAETVGRGEQYRLAKSLVAMRKGFEDDMVSLFGKQLDQSLVTKLSTATQALTKGDADKLVNILKAIPQDMRQMVAASALNTAFGKATQNGALNFNTYANWYEGLLQNKQAYAALMNNLPQPSRKALSDLYRVADNVRKATRERITTGRIQAVQQELQGADTLVGNIFNVVKRAAIGLPAEAATTAVGLPGAGIASGLTAALTKGVKTEVAKAADELIASPEFQRLAVEGATRTIPSQAAVRAVALSGAFRRFADAAKMPRELSWRERWLVQSMQAAGQFDQENQR